MSHSRRSSAATRLAAGLVASSLIGCAHGGGVRDVLDEVRTLNLAEIDMIGCDCVQDPERVQHRRCLDEGDEQTCQSMLLTLDGLNTHGIVTNAMRKQVPWWRFW